ncbi:MAG: zinc ribbon domain-containing protein [Chloroflexota bacterium]
MTTCAKCGTENVAGDAFCGSCGAFLEFAAEEAADDVQAGVPSAPSEAAPGVPPLAPPQPPGAAPEPAPAALAAPVPAAPSGPTCSACGRVNPADRRFCISCGDHLPAASPTGSQAAPSATSSSAGPSKPAWEFPAAPVASAAAPVASAPASAAPAATSSGGGSRLPLIGGAVVVLALLAGGALLVLGGGLGGGTPGTTASARPSSALASATPGAEMSAEPTSPPETPAPSEAPSITPGPTVPAATVPPGPSVGIAITAAKASSQLAASRAPKYLYDGSPVTAWKSATGKLDGSWVEVSFAPAAVTKIQVWAGWQKDEPLFYGNHRPWHATVAFDGGPPVPLEFKDALGAQGVAIPPALGIVAATRLRVTIIDTYPSRKTSAGGSPSKELAISEIRVFGVPAAP